MSCRSCPSCLCLFVPIMTLLMMVSSLKNLSFLIIYLQSLIYPQGTTNLPWHRSWPCWIGDNHTSNLYLDICQEPLSPFRLAQRPGGNFSPACFFEICQDVRMPLLDNSCICSTHTFSDLQPSQSNCWTDKLYSNTKCTMGWCFG